MIKRMKFNGRFSQAVIKDGILFLAGQTGSDAGDDITAQTLRTFEKIEASLEEYGSDKNHMLRTDVYIRDLADVPEFNRLWEAWVNPDAAPTRALMVSALGRPAIKVEIVVIAAVKE